ncbi:MAG: sulfur oxidation c-type cytochrome SoxX [Thiogranum sp.]|nr:sulfur oxidation c-type cytochrome SoxX [Thiogranum sp.]
MSEIKISLAAFAACMFLFSSAIAEPAKDDVDYTAMSPEELAEYLIFEANGFKLSEETQEGKTVRDRLKQDELQEACSALKGAPADPATAGKVSKMARESISYPDKITLGDWKKGEELARSGFGFRVGHKVDPHSNKVPGGNCYACHELDPTEIAYGTLGPSLQGFGKIRGNTEETRKYTYEMIYNPHSYFPCTKMPRFGANEFLTDEQIADIMAYVLHPESPVNK